MKNEEYSTNICGHKVTVVDTPGADNITDKPEMILNEIRSSIKRSDHKFDALLIIVK